MATTKKTTNKTKQSVTPPIRRYRTKKGTIDLFDTYCKAFGSESYNEKDVEKKCFLSGMEEGYSIAMYLLQQNNAEFLKHLEWRSEVYAKRVHNKKEEQFILGCAEAFKNAAFEIERNMRLK